MAAEGKLVVSLHRHEILLLWNDGEPAALSNVCIHRGRKLVEGVMLGTRLVCPGHQWAYEVTTGYCRARDRHQPRYSLELRDGKIFVELPAKRGA
ncbi:MAG: Rieske 2Fe-2S domain-containing protein [Acidimicrobiaceae bacterium]|nr:Rieske 2Fe-2S domain-containing protein [Acidimicrobiaceae bacterium]